MTPEERAREVCVRWNALGLGGNAPIQGVYEWLVEVQRDAIAEEREACARVAETRYPRGGAHTYASENADIYHASEDAAESIAAAIRARDHSASHR